ncbi:MAG: TatD family hydrolase [Clostridia bacterium]|nr:TatD family hydrolase [Clostridia bacterium]
MQLFDTHAHLDLPEFEKDLNDVLQRCRENGVEYIVNVGIDRESSLRSIELSQKHSWIFASVGMHPHDAAKLDEETFGLFKKLAQNERVVAVGETGLDYYRNFSPREQQQEAFRMHIALAKELGLPIIIHDRDAHRDVLKIVREEGARDVGGIMHCFPGDWKMAKECFDLNFLIGIGGTVTFKKSVTLQEVVKRVPIDMIVLETDCPYLSPEPLRGKRNEPANVIYTAKFAAKLRGNDVEEFSYHTTLNAKRLFKI